MLRKKSFYYVELNGYDDLKIAIDIAKTNMSKSNVEDDELAYYTDYNNPIDLETDIERWFNRVTSSYSYDNNDNLRTVLTFMDNELFFETIDIKEQINGTLIKFDELIYKLSVKA